MICYYIKILSASILVVAAITVTSLPENFPPINTSSVITYGIHRSSESLERRLQTGADVKKIDFSRLELIRSASLDSLSTIEGIERILISTGFNDECLDEMPAVVKNNPGGLWVFQYPSQFSSYLNFIRRFPISSYLEIGCRWGGAFMFIVEYLSRFHKLKEAVAVDPISSPVQKYCAEFNSIASFRQELSTSESFKSYIVSKRFDLVFIDGDHSFYGVTNDFELVKDRANIIVFHDITNDHSPGSGHVWREWKLYHPDEFIYYEFISQYEEVYQSSGGHVFLGIGVAVHPEYHAQHLKSVFGGNGVEL